MQLKTEIQVFKAINEFNQLISNSKFNSDTNMFRCVPLEYYISDLGWQLIGYRSSNENLMKISSDGFSTFLNGKIQIFFNQDMQFNRKRFTIAHEIGHIICKHHIILKNLGCLSNYFNTSLAEVQANIVARNILVPVKYYRDLKLMTAYEISREFYVSKTMAKIRLDMLDRDLYMSKLANKEFKEVFRIEKK